MCVFCTAAAAAAAAGLSGATAGGMVDFGPGGGRSKDGENDRTTASLIINCQDRFGVSGRPGAHEKRPFTMKLFGFYIRKTLTHDVRARIEPRVGRANIIPVHKRYTYTRIPVRACV